MILPRVVRSGVMPKRVCAPPYSARKPGDHLIHDEQRAVRVAQGPQRLEEAFLRQHEAHVSGNGLHDDRRDVLAVQVENVLDGPHVIVGG